MIIQHNIMALKSFNNLHKSSEKFKTSMEKLSSGKRINRASDDAAGLSISQKLKAQIRGLNKAASNIQDGISLTQVADGAMGEITSLLQRGRELSVQASSDTLSKKDKTAIQQEIKQIKLEIDHISEQTEFNGIKLLKATHVPEEEDDDKLNLVRLLKSGVLKESERIIKDELGLVGDGADLKFVLKEFNAENADTPARVTYYVDNQTGKGYSLTMELNSKYFLPLKDENLGGIAPIYNDRIIAHELTHAVMARTMNYGALPNWFKEGVAEFVHGGDERVLGILETNRNSISDITNTVHYGYTWHGTNKQYAASYLTVRYIHHNIKREGGNGIIDVMNYLKNNEGATLSEALKNIEYGGYPNANKGEVDMFNDFKNSSYSDRWQFDSIRDNADTGAIGGADADGGEVKTAESVIPDTGIYLEDPLEGFNEIWDLGDNLVNQEVKASPNSVKFQIGSNPGQVINLNLFNTTNEELNIEDVNVTVNSKSAISVFNNAIENVSSQRGRLGAFSNRLEYALNIANITSENLTASLSRIEDIDMAKEVMTQTKWSLLIQVSQTMVAQANQHSQDVLQLLR